MENGSQHSAGIQLSELIGLIYETATDLSLWPQLLEGLSGYLGAAGTAPADGHADFNRMVARWFQENEMPALPATAEEERTLIACLAPHFVRAHDIHRQLAEAEEERNLLEGVMDRLPVGMAIVDPDGTVISLNRALLSLVQTGGVLRLEAGRLVSRPREALAEVMSRALADDADALPVRLEGEPGGTPVSLWVSRLAVASHGKRTADRLVVLAASRTSRALSEKGLAALYGLTPAEARLTQQLTLGATLDEAAATNRISLNTAKTQLKRVFAKVGVRRQTELLQAVYASPLWLADPAASDQGGAVLTEPPALDARPAGAGLRLADGRWLAYSDNGDPGGLPLLFMHGLAGSQHLLDPDEGDLLRHGIRLIIPERPGSGDSDPQPGRRIIDWADDVAALADHLQLERFAVLGYSGGTPYALVTAHAWPARVTSLTLAAAMPPIDDIADLRDYSATFRMALLVAKYAPSLLPPLLRVVVKGVRRNVYRYIDQSLASATETDRKVFENPRLRARYAEGLLAAVRRGEQDMVLEVLLAAHDWGFDCGEIRIPTHFWHGDSDPLVAFAGAQKLAARLPDAQVTAVPDAGHYILYSHWEAILAGIAATGA